MFRFSIRDVLWLTVVVALVAGWWIDRRQLRAELLGSQERIAELEVDLGDYRFMLEQVSAEVLDEMLSRPRIGQHYPTTP